MAAQTVEILTNDYVCLGGSLFNDGRVVQGTVDELHIGVLGLNLLSPILISDEECILIFRVLLLKNVEGVTADVALLKVPVSLSKPRIEQCVSYTSLPVTPVLVLVSNLEQVHIGKTVAYKKILGAMFSCALVPASNVLFTSFGFVGRRSPSLITGSSRTSSSLLRRRDEFVRVKRFAMTRFFPLFDTLIRNAVPTHRTKLHRLPRG